MEDSGLCILEFQGEFEGLEAVRLTKEGSRVWIGRAYMDGQESIHNKHRTLVFKRQEVLGKESLESVGVVTKWMIYDKPPRYKINKQKYS